LLGCIALSMAVFDLATTVVGMAIALVPWGLGCFACNSAQQARLGQTAPALAPALMALNTSAIYLGQAIGAASGGFMVASAGYAPLHLAGLGWLAAALALSLWAARRLARTPFHA
jgi:predicted MFS family arabinose efflux permease